MTFTIVDLRERPEFLDTVADRIWHAWWKDRGLPLGHIVHRLGDSTNPDPIPFALVARDGERFLGTASVISSDLEDRPELTPWVAAVWVDPEYRTLEIGRALVTRAATDAFALGFDRIYLCAAKSRHNFYVRQGWVPIEQDVGARNLSVFMKQPVA